MLSVLLFDKTKTFYEKKRLSSVLGDLSFRKAVNSEKTRSQNNTNLAEALKDRPDIDTIVDAVAGVFNVSKKEIVVRRQGRQVANPARQLAMYSCQQLGDCSLNEIAVYFGLTHSGSVSGVIGKVKNQMDERKVKKLFKRIKNHLNII